MDIIIAMCLLFAIYYGFYPLIPFLTLSSFIIRWEDRLTDRERNRWYQTTSTRLITKACRCYTTFKNKFVLPENVTALYEMFQDIIKPKKQEKQSAERILEKLDWMMVDNISKIPPEQLEQVKNSDAIQTLRKKMEDIMINNHTVAAKLNQMQLDERLKKFLNQLKKD